MESFIPMCVFHLSHGPKADTIFIIDTLPDKISRESSIRLVNKTVVAPDTDGEGLVGLEVTLCFFLVDICYYLLLIR